MPRAARERAACEVLDELGLVPALRNLCDRIGNGTGLIVHRSLAAALPSLSGEEELVIYRVAQESLTNVVRHAGATTAHVTLGNDGGAVELRVSDDGAGLPRSAQERESGGIRGLRERALTIDARLHLDPAPDGGTAVVLRLPSRGVD